MSYLNQNSKKIFMSGLLTSKNKSVKIRRISVIRVLSALLFLTVLNSLFAQSTQYDSLITAGIKQIYSLKYTKADSTFKYVQQKYPNQPAGKFFDAMIIWWKIMPDMNNEKYDDELNEKLDDVIEFCDSLLDENDENIEAVFFKGGALGFKGRLNALRSEWFDAAMNGKEALPLVFKAYEIDSTNIDVQLGFGIYNYYAAVIPEKYPMLKPVMLFFPKGDRKKGLKQLIYAADKSRYAKYEARFMLMNIYYKFEKNYNQALFYCNELLNEFPDNSVFEKYKGRILIKINRMKDAVNLYKGILKKYDKGLPGYNNPLKREALYYIGRDYFNKNIIDSSLIYFNECEALSKQIDGDKETGFRINALLYIAKCNEKLGNIQKALEQFNEVLKLDDFRKSHEAAKNYIYKIKNKK